MPDPCRYPSVMAIEAPRGTDGRLPQRIATVVWLCVGACFAIAALPRDAGGIVVEWLSFLVFWLALVFGVLGGLLGAMLSFMRRDLRTGAASVLPTVLLCGFLLLVFATADWQ